MAAPIQHREEALQVERMAPPDGQVEKDDLLHGSLGSEKAEPYRYGSGLRRSLGGGGGGSAG
jgi:hypothetical protein